MKARPTKTYTSSYLPISGGIIPLALILLLAHSFSLCGQDLPRFQRFQYRNQHWMAFFGKQFNLYFPQKTSDSLYRYVIKEGQRIALRTRQRMARDVPKDLNIILYPSVDQFYESNIGRLEEQLFPSPYYILNGKRAVLTYRGSYSDLRYDIEEVFARTVWETEVNTAREDDEEKSGGNKKMKDLPGGIPFWFSEGAIRYFAHGWPMEAEDEFRHSFGNNVFKSWDEVIRFEPRLGGQAFCYFLTRNYYPQAVEQIFTQLKKKKNLASASRLVAKNALDSLKLECFAYYKKRFDTAVYNGEQHDVYEITFPTSKALIKDIRFNADKSKIAVVSQKKGRRTAAIYSVKEQKRKVVSTYKLPPWLNEHSNNIYPLIEWSSDGQTLYVVKPSRGKLALTSYNAQGKKNEKSNLPLIDGLKTMTPVSDGTFLLSAYRRGQNDIVTYNDRKENYSAWTDDDYDDTDPSIVVPGKDIVFESNRPLHQRIGPKPFLIGVGYAPDTLWQGIYRVQDSVITPLKADTSSSNRWSKPVVINKDRILLTNTASGYERFSMLNINTGKFDLLQEYEPVQYLSQTDEIVRHKAMLDSIGLIVTPFSSWAKSPSASSDGLQTPWLIDFNAMKAQREKEDSLLTSAVDTTSYFLEKALAASGDGNRRKRMKRIADPVKKIGPYVLQLHSAYFSAGLNNDYFINRYQPYEAYQGTFKAPSLTGMAKGGVTDLFENHHFTIAYSLPVSNDGSNLYVRYENSKRKFDWGGEYFRKVEKLEPGKASWVDENGRKLPSNAKVKTHYYSLFLKRPLSFYSFVKFTTAFRYDRTIFLATDPYSLFFPSLKSGWSINTLTYSINKLKPTLPLLFKGFQADANQDVCVGATREKSVIAGFSVNVQWHQPIYKYITAVLQLHGGLSGGDKYMLYNMGGKDNNLTPKIDTSVQFSQTAPYAFQTLVTPFRGYAQNALSGDRYALANADVYFPLFKTVIPLETPLPSINNLQMILLSDYGNAWETWRVSTNDRWKWSYGLGIRTVLATYPLRLDVAWPGTFREKPVWYFTLSLL